ncbi:RNA ligase [Salana multivorans]|uniref:RNA ligase n=1 Tax=Salana multivorans TaxID=120377 RepID=A0A3N2D6Y0_9MICO|nr:RNA ligase family protein [Salana multivorans]ROR95537.1 RNA ligase [Salana multivorans]
MSAVTFEAWPKTPRLYRDAVVTEKIDGTNSAVIIDLGDPSEDQQGYVAGVHVSDTFYKVGAQSRNRIITPGKSTDNYGFAGWVAENAEALALTLGPGRHFGEWWGKGIARNYGLDHRRFSLFNTARYESKLNEHNPLRGELFTVPILEVGTFGDGLVNGALTSLTLSGSSAAPGFDRPEGVVVFHAASRSTFKVLLENDAQPKGEAPVG